MGKWSNVKPTLQYSSIPGITMSITIRNILSKELESIHRVNQDHVPHVGSITFDRMQHLYHQSACFRIAEVDRVFAGYIIAFTPEADYDSPNFLYFRKHYTSYIYIDRIVVIDRFRRRGIGTAFYNNIAEYARERRIPIMMCEYNLRPPNPVSRAFHASYGFQEVGTQDTVGGKYTVSLQVKNIEVVE